MRILSPAAIDQAADDRIKLQHAIQLIHAGRADLHELPTEGNPTLSPFAALITWRFSIGMFAMFS